MKNIPNKALQYSQLSVNHQISFRNVHVSADSHIHQIYTLKNFNKPMPHLILLHGFAGSAMSYIRTFQTLSNNFHVHALDHYGNGFSSRIEIKPHDHQTNQLQILKLYVDSIQQWRKSLGIQTIVLVGHSFGAYLAALYMLQHKHRVDRLILLSPVGTSKAQDIQQEIQARKAESFKNKLTLELMEKIYNMKIQPSRIFSMPVIGDLLINTFLKSTIKLQQQQKTMWKLYIKQINTQQSHLQNSFYECFRWPFISKLSSISQIISQINRSQSKPIQFYYGENDWTQQIGAKKLHQQYENVQFQIIPSATHNMIFDFPGEVSDRIINGPLSNRLNNQAKL